MITSQCFKPVPCACRPCSAKIASCRATCSVHSTSKTSQIDASDTPQRRGLLLGAALAAAAPLVLPQIAQADGEVSKLYGLASPPTSYGGYGGNAKEAAKYTFEYPSNWKKETVGKTAFVITFGRAGEDNKKFKLGDVEQTLAGFAGADYDLQDTLIGSTNKKSSKRVVDDQEFYDYEVSSNELEYLATITLKGGKVFALFVKSPAKAYKAEEDTFRNIITSFTLL